MLDGFLREIDVAVERRVFSAQPVNASGSRIELSLIMLAVRDVFFAKVGDVKGAVGRIGDVQEDRRRIRIDL